MDTVEDTIKYNPELTETQRIQQWIDKFYENNEQFTGETLQFKRMRNIRNNIINKMESYLKTFRNQPIMDDFKKQLQQAYNDAISNGKLNRYKQYFNEIRVVQEFKAIEENLAEKLGEQYFQEWKKWADEHPDIGYLKDKNNGGKTV